MTGMHERGKKTSNKVSPISLRFLTFYGGRHAEFGCGVGSSNDATGNIVKTKFVGVASFSCKKFARKNCDFVVVRVNAHLSQIGPISRQEITVDDSMTFS